MWDTIRRVLNNIYSVRCVALAMNIHTIHIQFIYDLQLKQFITNIERRNNVFTYNSRFYFRFVNIYFIFTRARTSKQSFPLRGILYRTNVIFLLTFLFFFAVCVCLIVVQQSCDCVRGKVKRKSMSLTYEFSPHMIKKKLL